MRRAYSGSCHCGMVRFEVAVDVSAGTTKCNCSICSKLRMWVVQVPFEAFLLLAAQADLTDYRGHNPVAHHFFCKHCGVHPFARVDMPNMSGVPYYNVNVGCLHGLDIDELVDAPVHYQDGRNDDWSSEPTRTSHL
ncbi:GFA family protein (plasmid) [Rhizobium sp. 32-5/1]|uniref:GFA family protein n=1 Tax=Rhizobium sp. 32-5/1 TaxID=3019602 RepID=UPI00240DE474|nr:GFA family protein [Rhizobium sp. 32-5/1]WEZ85524.1 GFA family protein [Rhizobium sp. 32-5/1]